MKVLDSYSTAGKIFYKDGKQRLLLTGDQQLHSLLQQKRKQALVLCLPARAMDPVTGPSGSRSRSRSQSNTGKASSQRKLSSSRMPSTDSEGDEGDEIISPKKPSPTYVILQPLDDKGKSTAPALRTSFPPLQSGSWSLDSLFRLVATHDSLHSHTVNGASYKSGASKVILPMENDDAKTSIMQGTLGKAGQQKSAPIIDLPAVIQPAIILPGAAVAQGSKKRTLCSIKQQAPPPQVPTDLMILTPSATS